MSLSLNEELIPWLYRPDGGALTIRPNAPDWAKEKWEWFLNYDDLGEMTEEEFERELASDK